MERDHLKPKSRWENNIKIELQEVGWGSSDRIVLAQVKDRIRARCEQS